ncbi:MAG: hypothetical protein EOQ71_02185, partial [Mesorhizobium sp.]
MSNIDYNELDGGPTVARRYAGIGTKVAMVAIGLIVAIALIWINWPSEPRSRDMASSASENFNPPEFRPPALAAGHDQPAQAQIAADGQLVPVPGADTDPNKAFLAQSEKHSNAMAKARVFRRTDALIPEGTMIRGFLETAINT